MEAYPMATAPTRAMVISRLNTSRVHTLISGFIRFQFSRKAWPAEPGSGVSSSSGFHCAQSTPVKPA